MDPLTRLQAGVRQAESVISQINPDQYDASTPCAEWDVRQVINHMISALVMFRDVADRGEADLAVFERDLLGEDPARTLAEAGTAAVEGWSAPGRVEGTAHLPFGEFPAAFALQLPSMDMVVHGWDLAKATGAEVDWDPDLVADVWEFAAATFSDPEMRGDDFAPPVPVPEDADTLTRLVAFLGRNPQ